MPTCAAALMIVAKSGSRGSGLVTRNGPSRPRKAFAGAGIAFETLEERQDLSVAPAPVAHLRPGIEVLRLAADKHHSVNRAGTAEQFAARHREPSAAGAGLRLGGIEPVGCGIGDQPGHSDRNERPGVAGPTGLEQQHLIARVSRQPVRDGRTRGTGADNNVIVGLHASCLPSASTPSNLIRHYARGDQSTFVLARGLE